MGLDFSSAKFDGMKLVQAYLKGGLFRAQNLANSDLTMAIFDNADLSTAMFSGSTLDRTSFVEAKLQGAHFAGLRGQYVALQGADLFEADLGGVQFEMVDASGANFTGVRAKGSVWTLCVLTKITAKGGLFGGAQMLDCDLSHANLSGADFSQVNLAGSNLHCVIDSATRWEGAQKAKARPTDKALAAAEYWQAA
jgi:hypothetical protein